MSTYAHISTHMEFSTDSTGVHGITCPYISTKGMGVHRVTPTGDSTINMLVLGRMNVYYKYGRYEPKRDIGKDVVEKVWKGIIYADALQKDS